VQGQLDSTEQLWDIERFVNLLRLAIVLLRRREEFRKHFSIVGFILVALALVVSVEPVELRLALVPLLLALVAHADRVGPFFLVHDITCGSQSSFVLLKISFNGVETTWATGFVFVTDVDSQSRPTDDIRIRDEGSDTIGRVVIVTGRVRVAENPVCVVQLRRWDADAEVWNLFVLFCSQVVRVVHEKRLVLLVFLILRPVGQMLVALGTFERPWLYHCLGSLLLLWGVQWLLALRLQSLHELREPVLAVRLIAWCENVRLRLTAKLISSPLLRDKN
jgi:hypothetical protein